VKIASPSIAANRHNGKVQNNAHSLHPQSQKGPNTKPLAGSTQPGAS